MWQVIRTKHRNWYDASLHQDWIVDEGSLEVYWWDNSETWILFKIFQTLWKLADFHHNKQQRGSISITTSWWITSVKSFLIMELFNVANTTIATMSENFEVKRDIMTERSVLVGLSLPNSMTRNWPLTNSHVFHV